MNGLCLATPIDITGPVGGSNTKGSPFIFSAKGGALTGSKWALTTNASGQHQRLDGCLHCGPDGWHGRGNRDRCRRVHRYVDGYSALTGSGRP